MTSEIDILNIPAFQRKRSIAAKERNASQATKPLKTTKTGNTKKDPIERLPRELVQCGTCEGYFEKIKVAIIRLTKPLRAGDSVMIEKNAGLYLQTVKSIQINRKEVRLATTGSEIGIKVTMEPKLGGQVYKALS